MDRLEAFRKLKNDGSKNVHFNDLEKLAIDFGFKLRNVNGSHHTYKHPLMVELLNLQPVRNKAKPYQVKQFISLIEKYKLDQEAEL